MPILSAAGKRILFIHVPKTAGTTITDLLLSYGDVSGIGHYPVSAHSCSPQHMHAELLREAHGSADSVSPFDYVFTIVREPVARFESEYAWVRTRLGGRRTLLRYGLGLGRGVPINLWARIMLRRYRRYPYVLDNHLRPQHEFPCFDAEVFRLEDGLDKVRERLDAVLGMSGRFGANHNRTVAGRPPTWRLSGGARAAVVDFYARDYEAFGYGVPGT